MIKQLQAELKRKGLTCAVFYVRDGTEFGPNFFYLTQFDGMGGLVVPATKKPFLIVPSLELEKARKSKFRVYPWEEETMFADMAKRCKKLNINTKKLGIDTWTLPIALQAALKKAFKKSSLTDIGETIHKLRETKTKKELSVLRKACRITDSILKSCIKKFKTFKTESDAAAYLVQQTSRHGAKVSFDPIVASGPHASQPHYITQPVKLRKGFCVIDYGIRYRGYCSDITRTIFIGKPSTKEKELYALVQQVQQQAVAEAKPGITCKKLQKIADDALGKHVKYFIHSLGHGLGLEVHEAPKVSPSSKATLKENMVVTIEPGIYMTGKLGIRIEDDVRITKSKPEVLTRTTKKLITA